MASEEGVGICNSDLNEAQYVCSGVRGDGPGASRKAPRGATGVAIPLWTVKGSEGGRLGEELC